ncbi:MAG: gliding motility-associated C-terminal domain-containing protein [Chitinophagaceae bacterium]
MKRILTIVLMALLSHGTVHLNAQTLQPDYGAPATPVNVCNGSYIFSVRINGGTVVSPNGTLIINLPTGYVYVAGSASVTGGTGTLNESAVSANTATITLASIPAAPGFTEFSYSAYATCAAVQNSLSVNSQVSYDFSTSTLPSVTTKSNSFNTQSASLTIPNITNSSYFGSAGDNYTRNINIVNNGYGSITEFTLADTSGSGLYIRGISVSGGWTILTSKTYIGSDTITTFSFSGGILAQGQTITLVENVSIVSNCFLQSRFATWFGCESSPCFGSAFMGKATAGATVNNSFVPSLKVMPDLQPLTCRGGTVQQTLRLANIGSVRLNELNLQLFSSASTLPAALQLFNANENAANQSAFSSFQIKLGISGTWSSIVPTTSQTYNAAAICLGAAPGSVTFKVPVISPGDTVYLRYNETYCPVPGPAAGSITTPGTVIRFNYNAPCSGLTDLVSSIVRNAAVTSITALPHLPAVMVPLVPATISYDFPLAASPTYINLAPGQSSIRFDLVLPSNILFSGNVSDIFLVNISTGTILASPASFSYNAGLHKISLSYNVTASFKIDNLKGASLRFGNLLLDCLLPSNGNTVTLDAYLRMTPACTEEEWILSNTGVLNFVCPVACGTSGGLNFSSFLTNRTNFGLADNDNNGIPDATGVPDPTKVRTDLAMPGDTVRTSFAGRISRGPGSPVAFTHGYAIDSFITGSGLMTAQTATVALYVSGSSLPFYTVTGLPVNSVGTYHKVDFSITALNSVSPLPAGYTEFADGDSVTVTIDFKVTGNPGSIQVPVEIRNHFFISDVADPLSLSDQYSCNANYPGRINIVGYEAGTNGTRTYSLVGAGTVATEMDHYLSIAGNHAGSKPFVNEYRPISIHNNLTYTIPAGSQYVSATATYSYTSGIGVVTTKTVSINPLSAGSNPLVFDLEALFNNGTFVRGDQGNSLLTTVIIQPTCDVVPKSHARFLMSQIATPGYQTGFPGNSIDVADSILYIIPEVLITTANTTPTATDNNVSWEIQVSNSSVAQALRVWMGRTNSTGTITVNSVQRLSGPGGYVISTVNLSGSGLYQLGTLAQTSNYYRINATFTSCEKDDMTLAYWYDCNNSGYPSSVSAATHKSTLTLEVIPLSSTLQTNIISEPVLTPLPDACDVLTYEVESSNTGASAIHDLKVLVGPAAGVDYAPGTFQVEYPAGSGGYVSVADVNVTSVPGGLLFSIPASQVNELYSQESLRIRFGVTTSCSFASGSSINFLSSGTSFCGTPISSDKQQSQIITIKGVPVQTNNYELHSSADEAVQDCITGDVYTTYHFKSVNLGPLPTGITDGFKFTLPAPWVADPATIVFTNDPAGASYTGVTAGTYNFLTGEGVQIGDFVELTVTVRVPAPASLTLPVGNSAAITENGVVRSGAICSSTGVACPSTEIIVASNTTTTILYNGVKVNQPVIQINHPAPVCAPQTVDITAAAVTAGSSTGLTYTYFTDAAATNAVLNPAAISVSGTYYIKGTSIAGCAVVEPVNVVINPLPVAGISYPGGPFCRIGTANVTITGQTGGTFSAGAGLVIDPVTGTIDLAASNAGTYTITYTFSNGTCPNTTTTSITIVNIPLLVLHDPAPVCPPATIDLTAPAVTAGSESGLTFSYYTDAAGTIVLVNPTAISVAGVYYIQGTLASGCKTAILPVTVTFNTPPVASISYPGSPYCATGTANVVRTGQAGGTYTGSAGLSIDPVTGAVNLGSSLPGTYTVTYSSTNGTCTGVSTTTITINAQPLLVITNPAQVCAPMTVDITNPAVTAGSETGLTLTYFRDAAGTIVLVNPTAIAVSGTYYIHAVNSAGCSVTMPVQVVIAPLPVASISYPGSPFCNGGTATPVITGQAGGVFSAGPGLIINNTTGQVDLTNSTAGTYTVTYSFTNGTCISDATATVIIEPVPTLVITDPAPVCAPSTVDLTAVAITAGSSTGLTFRYYTNAAGTIVLANPSAISVSGTYYIQGVTPGGCLTVLMPVNVLINPLPVATISYAGSPYCEADPVLVNVVITGQTGGSFASTPGLTLNGTTGQINIGTSLPGTYIITYTFSNGSCINNSSTSITIEPTPVLVINDPAPVCEPAGVDLTAASVTAGSTGSLVFGYYSDAAGTLVLANPSNITVSGIYYIRGTSVAGCGTSILPVNVVINPRPVATISYGPAQCYTSTGTFIVTQTGTTGGTYSSTTGLSIDPLTGTINIGASTPGTYTVSYNFTNGTCTNTATANVTINAIPVFTITDPMPACLPNTVDLTVASLKSSTTTGLVYSYYTDATGTTPLANPSSVGVSGTYYVQATNPLTGCISAILPVNVLVSTNPVITVTGAALVCRGEEVILTANSPGNTINWPALGTSGATAVIHPQNNGTYLATATNAAGCMSTASVTVNVRDFNISLTAGANPVMPGGSVSLFSTANDVYTVTAWTPASYFSTQTSYNQTINIGGTAETFAVIGVSDDGCIDTAQVTINLEPGDKDFYIPNAFSPNNDGKNDVFKVYGSAVKSIELRVFNQWGELLFESKDRSIGWDGRFKGVIQPVGVYPFGVKVTFYDNRVVTKKGLVNLVR